MLADDGVHVEGDQRLQQVEGDRKEDDGWKQDSVGRIRGGRAQCFAKSHPSRRLGELRAPPDSGQADVPANEREACHRDRHPPEADRVAKDRASHEADRRAGKTEVDLDRLQADALWARWRKHRQERLVGPGRQRAEESVELEHEEDVDRGHSRPGVSRRHEDEDGKDGPQRRTSDDVGNAPTPTRSCSVAEIPDDHRVERSDDRAGGENQADHEARQQRRQVRIAGRRVEVDQPQAAAPRKRLVPDVAGRVEELGAEREFHATSTLAPSEGRGRTCQRATPSARTNRTRGRRGSNVGSETIRGVERQHVTSGARAVTQAH